MYSKRKGGAGHMKVKRLFRREDGKKVMEINVLPAKYCTFRCVFCPLGAQGTQTEEALRFEATETFLQDLARQIEKEEPDVLFINSTGEAFINDRLGEVITLGKGKDLEVSLYTNGYLLGNPGYAALAHKCDEVSGEIKAIDDASFRKLQRPPEGYSLKEYIDRMVRFREAYRGTFTVYVTLMKGINDDPQSLQSIRHTLERLAPSRVVLETFTDGKFRDVWGIPEDKMEDLRKSIQGDH